MTHFLSITLSSCVLAALLVGCQQGPDLSQAVESLVMSPDALHEEARASIAVTEMLNVQLPVQDGTGYAWSLATPLQKHDPVALATSAREAPGAPETTVIGGRSWYLITFVGVKPGDQIIELAYTRPWETGVAPARTYRIAVEVTKAPG